MRDFEDRDADPMDFIGCQVRLETTTDGIVEGTLVGYHITTGQYCFSKAYSDGEYMGNFNVYEREIIKKTLLSQPPVEQVLKEMSITERNVLTVDTKKSALEEYIIAPDSEEGSEERVFPEPVEEEEKEVPWFAEVPGGRVQLFSGSVSAECRICLDAIANNQIIGVNALGQDVSRFGNIEYIAISCDEGCYLFEGRRQMMQVLKNVFESKDVLKVIHGSRHLADALSHLHSIQVTNVFDTQVTDCYVHREKHKKRLFPEQLRSFETCVEKYLKVETKYSSSAGCVNAARTRLTLSGENLVRKKCLFLRELRLMQLHILFHQLSSLMAKECNYLRMASDRECRLLLSADQKDASSLFTQRQDDLPADTNLSCFLPIGSQHVDIPLKKRSCRSVHNPQNVATGSEAPPEPLSTSDAKTRNSPNRSLETNGVSKGATEPASTEWPVFPKPTSRRREVTRNMIPGGYSY